MDGVILLNKPTGMTSLSAVKKTCRILHEKKGGHTGTLDPDASGVMIVLLGRCTKLAPYAIKDHKSYKATFSLGRRTDTQDASGNILEEKKPSFHTEEEMQKLADSMKGWIEQIPPMYSAVHVNGKKLYEYAHEGQEVERKPRKAFIEEIHIHQKDDIHWSMEAVVSSGTYIRTLIEDLCAKAGELGTMDSLTRTGIGSISIDKTQTFEEIEKSPHFINPLHIISKEWPAFETDRLNDVLNGKALKLNEEVCNKLIFTHDGKILASYEKRDDGMHHCVRGLW